MRRLGVEGQNLETRKNQTVEPADFLIGGMIGQFNRQYKVPFVVTSEDELLARVGPHSVQSYYGWDVANGFFANVGGIAAKLYVNSHTGYTGTAYDAVSAYAEIDDQAGTDQTIKIQDGYEEEEAFGIYGNNIGYTITNGYRFETAAATTATSLATSVEVDSIADIKVGDLVYFNATGGEAAVVYKKITEIDEANNIISWSGAFSVDASLNVDDEIKVCGFQLQIYRKDERGIVNEIDEDLGKIYCTMSSEVTDYYITNVWSTSKNVLVSDLESTNTLFDKFPDDISSITYLKNGDDGTSPTTSSHFSADLVAFNTLPIRFLCNAESTLTTVNKAGEEYCYGRWDNPKWIANLPEDQTKTQLITIGNSYQKSRFMLQLNVANWLGITDPFADSDIAPYRHVPNVGFIMGLYINSIETKGIHCVPALKDLPIYGCNSVIGETFLDNDDRTDLADAGINVIQNISGKGIILRNCFTPSTAKEFKYMNGLVMRDYLKVSITDSLADSENMPISWSKLKSIKSIITTFMKKLWLNGSTGLVSEGETFGAYIDEEGNVDEFDDCVIIKLDAQNNTKTSIQAGEVNVYLWFNFPVPAGSIRIGVGLKF